MIRFLKAGSVPWLLAHEVRLTWRAALASSPVSGSSRISRRGSWIRAPASAAFCFMPRENPSQR